MIEILTLIHFGFFGVVVIIMKVLGISKNAQEYSSKKTYLHTKKSLESKLLIQLKLFLLK